MNVVENQCLSNALRREVVTFITAGLITGIKVTAWESTKRQRQKYAQHGTFSEDDYSAVYNGASPEEGFFREDTETHPALQLVPSGNPQITERQRGNNSLGGALFFRKVSKSRERSPNRRATVGGSVGRIDRTHIRRGSSYQFHAKVGMNSQVAISIPMEPPTSVSQQNSLRRSMNPKDSNVSNVSDGTIERAQDQYRVNPMNHMMNHPDRTITQTAQSGTSIVSRKSKRYIREDGEGSLSTDHNGSISLTDSNYSNHSNLCKSPPLDCALNDTLSDTRYVICFSVTLSFW